MNKYTVALIAGLALAGVVPGGLQAAENYAGFKAGDILVRGRGLAVVPNTSSSVTPIGGEVDADVSAIPELDATYFFTPNIAVEAIAGFTRHTLKDKNSSLGDVELGKVSLLPPTITAQYHFMPNERIKPYVGMGVNYTIFFDKELPGAGPVTSIRYDNAFGAAFQAGVDFHIRDNWYANIDVKHILLSTHAEINKGAIGADVDINPTLVGIGIGYRF